MCSLQLARSGPLSLRMPGRPAAPRRVLVHKDRYRAFCDALTPLAEKATPRRLTLPEDAARIEIQIDEAVRAGGRAIPETEGPSDASAFLPRVVLDCPVGTHLMQGDHFGPALAVHACASLSEMLEHHHGVGQYLATDLDRKPDRGAGLAFVSKRDGDDHDVLVPTATRGLDLRPRPEWLGTSRRRRLLSMSRPVHVTTTPRKMRIPTDVPMRRLSPNSRDSSVSDTKVNDDRRTPNSLKPTQDRDLEERKEGHRHRRRPRRLSSAVEMARTDAMSC